MKTFNFKINVSLKDGVTDPRGTAVRKVLSRSGYKVSNVRFSKLITLNIEAENLEKARFIAEEISKDILANPVLENYSIEDKNE
jgi:phosphoribosylformylglycinamidine synthase